MNFKGSAFSLGKNKVVDAVRRGGKIHFLQSGGAAYMHRALDADKKAFEMVDFAASYANLCRFFSGGLIELFGRQFSKKDVG